MTFICITVTGNYIRIPPRYCVNYKGSYWIRICDACNFITCNRTVKNEISKFEKKNPSILMFLFFGIETENMKQRWIVLISICKLGLELFKTIKN